MLEVKKPHTDELGLFVIVCRNINLVPTPFSSHPRIP